ncbi:MAG TPA: class I SAM-dependent methyltransferase [Reyranellaceae bacterium]|nr:class I SAM-dependent methyltransferase [Reyranellaceae bacterium]
MLSRLTRLFTGAEPAEDPFAVFHAPNAQAINRARQGHLASLGLDLRNKKVLEVGAGIGLHTPFFLERGCTVTVTDGRPENVAEIARRLPNVRTAVADLERDEPLTHLGRFDVVYCYGLLYHLGNPEMSLRRIAEVCDGQLLLETAVSAGRHDELLLVSDPDYFNQAVSGVGCRPTRLWVLNRLKALFGHGYIPTTQPDHVDFPSDWRRPPIQVMYRSIFVGSRTPLTLPTLQDSVPEFQEKHRSTSP